MAIAVLTMSILLRHCLDSIGLVAEFKCYGAMWPVIYSLCYTIDRRVGSFVTVAMLHKLLNSINIYITINTMNAVTRLDNMPDRGMRHK